MGLYRMERKGNRLGPMTKRKEKPSDYRRIPSDPPMHVGGETRDRSALDRDSQCPPIETDRSCLNEGS